MTAQKPGMKGLIGIEFILKECSCIKSRNKILPEPKCGIRVTDCLPDYYLNGYLRLVSYLSFVANLEGGIRSFGRSHDSQALDQPRMDALFFASGLA